MRKFMCKIFSLGAQMSLQLAKNTYDFMHKTAYICLQNVKCFQLRGSPPDPPPESFAGRTDDTVIGSRLPYPKGRSMGGGAFGLERFFVNIFLQNAVSFRGLCPLPLLFTVVCERLLCGGKNVRKRRYTGENWQKNRPRNGRCSNL